MAVPLTEDEYQCARVEIFAAFKQRPRDQWIALMQAADVAVLPVLECRHLQLDPLCPTQNTTPLVCFVLQVGQSDTTLSANNTMGLLFFESLFLSFRIMFVSAGRRGACAAGEERRQGGCALRGAVCPGVCASRSLVALVARLPSELNMSSTRAVVCDLTLLSFLSTNARRSRCSPSPTSSR